ncbi:hypothetical protein V6N00_06285 [Tersicoccus sp. MR15.9]|uniref:hypothetical protein n=1 Tax=Tersicoccus mangrovi TaxID=3121635 RepID=UPI002FE61BFA
MAPHLHLSGDTLEQVRETLHSRYGGAARLVSADKVRDGGIAGLLGRWHVEVVAELPEGMAIDDDAAGSPAGDPAAELRSTAARGAAAHELTGRSGLAALLAAADDEEELLHAPGTAAGVSAGLSTAPTAGPGTGPIPRATPAVPDAAVPTTAASTTAAPDTAVPAVPRPVAPARPAAVVPELDTPATRGRDFAALLSRLGSEARGAAPATTPPAGPSPSANSALVLAAAVTDPVTALSGLERRTEPWTGSVAAVPAPAVLDGAPTTGESGDALDVVDLPDGPAGSAPAALVPTVTAAVAGPPVPAVLGAPGDLVVVLGVGNRAVTAARTMAASIGAQLHTAGTAEDTTLPRLQSPRSAIAARAGAVRAGTSAVVGYGLGSPISLGTRAEVTAQLSTAVGLGADQVWLVVDARHKVEDIEPWVRRIASRVPIDALAVVGVEETASPETVNELGLPVGWVDGGPAARAFL